MFVPFYFISFLFRFALVVVLFFGCFFRVCFCFFFSPVFTCVFFSDFFPCLGWHPRQTTIICCILARAFSGTFLAVITSEGRIYMDRLYRQ